MKRYALPAIYQVLYFLLPLPVAWQSLSLMSLYLAYYDIGVNASANNGFLLIFVGPVLLVTLYAVAAAGLVLMSRWLKSQWLGMLCGGLLIVSAGAGAFGILVRSYSDYPTEKQQDVTLFLRHYLSEMGER